MALKKFNDCEGADPLFKVTFDGQEFFGNATDETEAFRQARLHYTADVRSQAAERILALPSEQGQSDADLIREALVSDPTLSNKQVIAQLAEKGVKVTSPQVTQAREALAAEQSE